MAATTYKKYYKITLRFRSLSLFFYGCCFISFAQYFGNHSHNTITPTGCPILDARGPTTNRLHLHPGPGTRANRGPTSSGTFPGHFGVFVSRAHESHETLSRPRPFSRLVSSLLVTHVSSAGTHTLFFALSFKHSLTHTHTDTHNRPYTRTSATHTLSLHLSYDSARALKTA